jgi:hypothetical protein
MNHVKFRNCGEADKVIATSIDLISACHVHILEPQWNPMTESQAIGRVHRIGQTQQVSVTRYIVSRSIETVSEVPDKLLSKLVLAFLSTLYFATL